ncbi:MAG: sigma-54-dependent Fis family transcriptional regulator [Deltaproteobacteria bacterium]|nr:sigma-54-dependent Fis family transcriptional regulator [Deltaproteobacteria bacterium]
MKRERVLLVDDDASFRRVVAFMLGEAGYAVDEAADGGEALKMFDPEGHAAVVTDLKMPAMDGLGLLSEIRTRRADMPVIVVTAHGGVEKAVEAMKAGAFDYVTKPLNRDEFILKVRNAVERTRTARENERLKSGILAAAGAELVGVSKAIGEIRDLAAKAAGSDAPVLITGESGTGKEVVARAIHFGGPRRAGPFVAIDCAAIPADLMESELFGHVRGAFTGAVADRKGRFHAAERGTIFLDEIGNLPLALQPKLLRVLQERAATPVGGTAARPFDARTIAATNSDLESAVERGEFRKDLLYRLNVFPIHVPPLRERPEDIPPLLDRFFVRFAGAVPELGDGVLDALARHGWPGNIRELQNVCERLSVLKPGGPITLADLPPLGGGNGLNEGAGFALPDEGLDLFDLERRVIIEALRKHRFNQTRTAAYLRIPRHVLLYRMEKYGIPRVG